ncbi:hypothetical protein Tco_0556355, partial [Tanacetum coccineum]
MLHNVLCIENKVIDREKREKTTLYTVIRRKEAVVLRTSSFAITLRGSGGEYFLGEGDDFGVDVVRFHTCLTDILGFLEKLEWCFKQDINDEGEEDEEGDGGSE